ncbi:DUF4879 domain-containing protein [Pseudomonas helleri]|uniref:DUF4879 domain-containing protein n=1 Tax=Pseudomonas helleri TaxID=1608996 RepID=A0A0J6L962_9PSED|nr:MULTISPECIES: DUF4879 domain-containing protein [Pseudomonas]KMN10961.1 lipoprotein [Pseudomonas helleri]MQT30966.1 DUF4879 domain-containing protein [Pseudomonas helleri]MQT46713.1 DUF4879 domain-containing protein [Pseudomonas helleri]MQT60331.1 DUF4879 domain-containing protein [Pseudomonas sp. FSL R10-0399]MQT88352.1 DUF4879 domain-containing protein [Pseudomonas helleri]
MKHTINALIAGLCLFISAGASAAPAMPLSTVEILKVASNSGAVEDVSDGREQTKMQHRGPHIKVYVLERGYGGQPTVTFDGQIIDGVRTPVCNKGEGLVTCDGAGTTVGYVYTFDLSNNQGGWFQFSNTSLVAPFKRLQTQLYIR